MRICFPQIAQIFAEVRFAGRRPTSNLKQHSIGEIRLRQGYGGQVCGKKNY